MGWIKLDDSFPENAKVEQAGDQAAWLYVCGLLYCSRGLTDGFIPAARVSRLTGLRNARTLGRRLVAAGLWQEVEGGYRVPDYTEHQRSAEQVKRERRKSTERQRRWAERHLSDRNNGVSDETREEKSRGTRDET